MTRRTIDPLQAAEFLEGAVRAEPERRIGQYKVRRVQEGMLTHKHATFEIEADNGQVFEVRVAEVRGRE